MTVHEFGEKTNPILMLLPGTMCHWKGNFDKVIEELSKKFFVAVVAYTGFDEQDTEEYIGSSDMDQTEAFQAANGGAGSL